MLSRLQESILELLAPLLQDADFVLAGGGALIRAGHVDRRTRDLDLFTLSPDVVDRVVPSVREVLEAADCTVVVKRQSPGFVRLDVSDGNDRTEVDLAADARLLPAEATANMPTLRGEELGADKVLAVFGRAEARDFVDLAALAERYGLDHLMSLAGEKDRGFDPATFAEMATRFSRLDRREFELDDESYAQLAQRVDEMRSHALGLAVGRDRGFDLGL